MTAASVAYWSLHFPQATPAQAYSLAQNSQPRSPESSADTVTSLLRAWGGKPAVSEVSVVQSTRYQLLGVIASASGYGSALIGVDGQPPKAFRVGQKVQDDWVLSALTPRKASLRSFDKEMLLELPPVDNP